MFHHNFSPTLDSHRILIFDSYIGLYIYKHGDYRIGEFLGKSQTPNSLMVKDNLMPTYAGTPYKAMNGQLVLFQIASKDGTSPYYYRINLPEQKRIESRVATAFKADPARFDILRQSLPCLNPCNPPTYIVDAAIQIYNDMRARMIRGQPIITVGSRTFIEACKQSIKASEKDIADGIGNPQKIKRRKRFYERFVYPYPEFNDQITSITPTVLKLWQKWRDVYWISGDGKDIQFIETVKDGKVFKTNITTNHRHIPALSTKNSEWVHLKSAFDWAAMQGWIEDDHIPKHKIRDTDVGDVSINPAFTIKQWANLESAAEKWINEDKLRGDNKRTRQLCWWFALVCRAYGLRVAEGYNLMKRHIVIDGNAAGLSIGAIKTKSTKKHERTVEPIYRFRDQMFDLFTKQLPAFYKKEYGRDWVIGDPVWMHPDGTSINRFNRGFDSLLEFAAMTVDPQGNNYTLTSLRHSAITEEIETTKYNIGLIAVWAGTSSHMIDKHYNQAIMNREMLQGRQGFAGETPLRLQPPDGSPVILDAESVKKSIESKTAKKDTADDNAGTTPSD